MHIHKFKGDFFTVTHIHIYPAPHYILKNRQLFDTKHDNFQTQVTENTGQQVKKPILLSLNNISSHFISIMFNQNKTNVK